jgi:hypothetical protein
VSNSNAYDHQRRPSRTSRNGARRRWALCLIPALTAALVLPGVSSAGASNARNTAPANTDVLIEWSTIAQDHVIPLRPTAHGQLRGMAMVQGAVYDAVNAIDRGYQPYLLDGGSVGVGPEASFDAAISTAAHHVLVTLVPSAQVAGLDAAYEATLAGVADGPNKDEGVAAGEAAAAAMILARTDDGFMVPFEFDIGPDPGDWRPVAPGALDPDAWVAKLQPFIIESPDQFRSEGPNPLRSAEYTADFNEVKEIGALVSTTRTDDQTTAAIFWQASPVALWNGVFRSLAVEHGLDLADAARLFAMTSLAAADGAVACWNDRYYWNFWRPMAAIREADTDGNPETEADPAWKPLFDPSTVTVPPLGTPPFPDHPSGHACVSGATLYAAQEFFGTDEVTFDVNSGRFPGGPRHFDGFSAAIQEIVDSRVWGGIHFRAAVVQGAELGNEVALWLSGHYFHPEPCQ